MKKYIITISILLSVVIFNVEKSYCQSTPEELMEHFFIIFENDLDQAIDYLFSTNSMIDPNQPGIQSIKEKLDASRRVLGNYNGYAVSSKYLAGEIYARYIYLLKYERQPVKLVVTMYKPRDKWKVQNVNFQDDIDTEFRLIKD